MSKMQGLIWEVIMFQLIKDKLLKILSDPQVFSFSGFYSLLDCNAVWWCESFADVKGIVHPQIQLLKSHTDPHVVSNPYDILSSSL